MNVVALVSGGKDSCYTILKVKSYGHNVVALAHIVPPRGDSGSDDADSFMYQSVGSEAIHALAQCIGIPIYVRKTNASSLTQSLSYVPTDMDEVEDLFLLLTDVKAAHPEINACCAGALWSDYQRLRVENVCARLNLTSLAPLWRRQQKDLLREMIQNGVDAIFIKVAAYGLNHSHLGKSLKDMEPHLLQLYEQYGIHPCGEGGEYETFVLDMPIFRKKLVIDESRIVHRSMDKFAPLSHLVIEKVHVQDKVNLPIPYHLPLPKQLTPEYAPREDDLNDVKFNDMHSKINGQPSAPSASFNIIGNHAVVIATSGRSGDFDQDLRSMMTVMKTTVKEKLNYEMDHVYYSFLYLRDMNRFAQANKIYVETFQENVTAPSRACVEMAFQDTEAILEVLLTKNDTITSLHVQSISEWAPPCIGPYSQAVTLQNQGIIRMCGIIPLWPATATIPAGSGIIAQTKSCIANVNATLEALDSELHRAYCVTVYTLCEKYEKEVMRELVQIFEHHKIAYFTLPVTRLPKDSLVELRFEFWTKSKDSSHEVRKALKICDSVSAETCTLIRNFWMESQLFIESTAFDFAKISCEEILTETITANKSGQEFEIFKVHLILPTDTDSGNRHRIKEWFSNYGSKAKVATTILDVHYVPYNGYFGLQFVALQKEIKYQI